MTTNATPALTLQDILTHIETVNHPFDVEGLKAGGLSKENTKLALSIRSQLTEYARLQDEATAKKSLVMDEAFFQSYEVMSELKMSLRNTLTESKKVQNITKWMFGLTFFLGFALIVVAVYFGTMGEEVLSIAFGTFGMASIVGLLIADPPLKIQDSRSNYAQLSIGVLAWFNDLMDKGAVHQLTQSVHGIVEKNCENPEELLAAYQKFLDNYLQISNAQVTNTSTVLRLLEEVAEPGGVSRGKSTKRADTK